MFQIFYGLQIVTKVFKDVVCTITCFTFHRGSAKKESEEEPRTVYMTCQTLATESAGMIVK
jgi:hypothetical protein